MLDGVFNLTYFGTSLLALKVASLMREGENDDFPVGYGFFEPLVNGGKGVLMLAITVIALINAAISSAVLGTLAVVFLIRDSSLKFLVPYVDPILVVVIGRVTIGNPNDFDAIRERVDAALKAIYPLSSVDLVFTCDARWSASLTHPS